MSMIKVFVKKSKPTNWYHDRVGRSMIVYKQPKILAEKLVFESVDMPNHIIFGDDVILIERIRDRKLKRIFKN